MTVRIDERLWSEWRQRSAADGAEWVFDILLSVSGTVDALAAVREALREVLAPYDERRAPSGSDPAFAGEWDAARVPEGVVIHVTESEVFEAALPALASALERLGVDGTLSLWLPPPVAYPPTMAPLLGCRLCVRGRRENRGPGACLWRPDRTAYQAVLAAAEQWCRQAPAPLALTTGMSGAVPVAANEPVAARLLEGLRFSPLPRFTAVGPEQFRAIALVPYSGRLSMVAGRERDEPGWWRAPLAELRKLLQTQAHRLAYAFVKPGWNVMGALRDEELPSDWPQREHHVPFGTWFSRLAFDDLVAPDAFGMQLLGPGYAGRIPASPAWRSEPVADDTVMLEHVDPTAWFDAPFTPFGDVAAAFNAPAPDLLTAARAQLAPILHTPTALGDLGYPDMIGPY